MSVLDKVRKWIDGDSAETVLEEAARNAQVKPRSVAEEFIVKIARSVEEVMQREMVPLPQGTTLIPTEYIIFLSEQDDKEWQGVKRKGLEQGLYHILAERAKEISGKKKLETNSFAVELRVDGTLEKGDLRVQPGWDESESGKTGVLARTKPPASAEPKIAAPVAPLPNYQPHQAMPFPVSQGNDLPPTIAQSNFPFAVPASGEAEEMTRVKAQPVSELYKLEIWREGVRQNLIPVFQKEVSIGRGSKSKPVDITLSNDPEISRRHLTLSMNAPGVFILLSEGRNPVVISGREISSGQRVQVSAGEPISVCSYLLRIQPQ